ncbi:response regulator transcription factor [Luteibacter sp. PPL201]|uniref:Response regulator transcription factor n=1 Tax=Luteibacter sahnii TaxID=3021977 RepID=A0ABT6BCM5_9GAMM|nr:response regulator transcription factor [Luteibacter sp. PPL193]MDY1549314.1 response regulator transcription factor [Luteibacter sp. PPL193]
MSARSYIGSVRVALLDDHALVRKGLIAQLEKSPSILVVGSHGNSKPFRALLASMPVDVAVIDYSLSRDDVDGVALVKQLRAAHPRLKILVVSAHEEGLIVQGLLSAGADGFVAKSQDPDDVIRAIDAVMTGQPFVSSSSVSEDVPPGVGLLSPKELEVVRCLLQGSAVSEIARKFDRSVKTISAQKSAAYRKLDIANDAQLHRLKPYILGQDGTHP